MSRIGNKPVNLDQGVELTIESNVIVVKGPKGTLSQNFEPEFVSFAVEESTVFVKRKNESKTCRARHGLYRSLLQSMTEGVSKGFSKTLEIKGVGYRMAMKGRIMEMQLGYSHPIKFPLPEGLEVKLDEKNPNIFTISGIDKQLIGQTAANIRSFRKPEPYKGKGIRYFDEQISRKAGKSAKK